MTPADSLAQFATTFDRISIADHCAKAEAEREALRQSFPRATLAELPVEKYAMGLGGNDSLCWTYEFGSDSIGSIKGGSVFKFVLWFGKDGQLANSAKKDEPDTALAWQKLRAGLVRSLELCEAGNFAETDAVPFARLTPALRVKMQHVFFPSEVLPIFSCGHLEHFLAQLGVKWKRDREKDRYTATANRLLLSELRKLPTLADWTPTELERLLYTWNAPTREPAREPITEFAKRFNRSALADAAREAAEQREAFVREFPLADFGAMRMSRYVAPGEAPEGVIYWLEEKTARLGVLPTARKRVVGMEHLRDTGLFRDSFQTVADAEPEWARMRDAMVRGFEQAAAGNWAGVHIPPNGSPSAKRAKLLYLYFPDEFLPIQNSNEVALYLDALDLEAGEDAGAWDPVRTRQIFEYLHTITTLDGWTTFELAKLLEAWVFSKSRAYKVSPGDNGAHWHECLHRGIMILGWGGTGDLNQFKSVTEIREKLVEVYYRTDKRTATIKSRELWAFRELREGDVIVANDGMSRVLGIGRVVAPAYHFLPAEIAPTFQHAVHVDWYDPYPRQIPKQSHWWTVTVEELSKQQRKEIFDGVAEPIVPPTMKHPLNQILYGPPGTGKTYTVIRKAAAIVTGFTDDAEAKREFDKLCVTGRVRLATFHQSFSYEDFIEGIRPAMDDGGEAKFTVRDGIFKRIATEALFACLEQIPTADAADNFDARWENVLKLISEAPNEEITIPSLQEGGEWELFMAPRGGIRGGLKDGTRSYPFGRDVFRKVWEGNYPKPIISSSDSRTAYPSGAFHSLMAAFYNYLQTLPRQTEKRPQPDENPSDREGIIGDYLKNREASGWRMKAAADCPPFVLVVDEINRGNISRIFGELITLIEDDKRWGADNALMVTLPTSGELFTVPPNLHLLGTMNTADKSLAMLDVALRRRFEFEELAPDFSKCAGLPAAMQAALSKLNERLELRKDRDHRIGHAFFMGVGDEAGFDTVFRRKVLPLLQEYFSNDAEGARYVLGESADAAGFLRRIKATGDVDRMQRNHWRWFTDCEPAMSCWARLQANSGL